MKANRPRPSTGSRPKITALTASTAGDGVPPVLVFAWGNPSRGDDAIGPLLQQRLADRLLCGVEILSDFQLQIEHAVDLAHRTCVLFVDASASASPPFEFAGIEPEEDASYTTHAMSPQALMAVYRRIHAKAPPRCFLLSVRGHDFRLGRPLSAAARRNSEEAFRFMLDFLATQNASSGGQAVAQRPQRAG